MIKNKKMRLGLLCFGLINSVMVSSNPLIELGCGVVSVIANTMHILNLKDEWELYNASTEGVRKEYDRNILDYHDDENQKKVYKARKEYILKKDLGIWPDTGEISDIIRDQLKDKDTFIFCRLPIFLATGLGSLVALSTERLRVSDSLPIQVATMNLVLAGPMRGAITLGQYRLYQAQKQAATITQDTVQDYQDYLNPNIREKSKSKPAIKVCFSKDDHKTFDWSKVTHVHRTNFAEQTKHNILIAKDQELNTAFWDNFGTKTYPWRLHWRDVQSFRESVQPQKALAQDDTHRKLGDSTVREKISRVQGEFKSLRHDILDPAKAEENDVKFQASKDAYEAGEYFQKKYVTGS